jgi:hypothetical protein
MMPSSAIDEHEAADQVQPVDDAISMLRHVLADSIEPRGCTARRADREHVKDADSALVMTAKSSIQAIAFAAERPSFVHSRVADLKVRIAALAAIGAPPAFWMLNLAAAGCAALTIADVQAIR